MNVVVKIGTSSLTDESGKINEEAVAKLCEEVGEAKRNGHDVVIVTSGAVTAGLPPMGFTGERPRDMPTLQAAAAVGQSRLLRVYDDSLSPFELIAGQVLLSPHDFSQRRKYLHSRDAVERLLELGIVPIVNENDAVADSHVRFGGNDRLAALVAHAIGANLLVLLTDIEGLFTADPRIDETASLVQEIVEVDQDMEFVAGGAGSKRGTGGMASKLAAARIASWSGIPAVIAGATRPNVLADAIEGKANVGTRVHARDRRLGARKLWIAYAIPSYGKIVVNKRARQVLVDGGASLLSVGVVGVEGDFDPDEGVEVIDERGDVFAKGLAGYAARQLRDFMGMKSQELPVDGPAIHRDDLVILV